MLGMNDTQVNRLTEAMYLISDMLETVNGLKRFIRDIENLYGQWAQCSKSIRQYEKKEAADNELKGLKEWVKDKIKDLPTESSYKDALSITQQNSDRPGVKELLEKVYLVYPDLNPGIDLQPHVHVS